jgi:hypothetical protein
VSPVDGFQDALLVALHDEGDAEAVRREAQAAAPDAAFGAWIDGWDPDLVALAGTLVRTWSRR